MSDIEKWLANIGLEKYSSVFSEAEIELADLVHLTDDDLKELGLPMGPRRRAIAEVNRLNSDDAPAPAASPIIDGKQRKPEQTQPELSTDAERRHLTVMFVDLVGSTKLATQVDPEIMRDVITNYQNTIAGIVARYEGFVARFMGDGVLCYFGWPQANEDDAERAVHAGLAMIAAIAQNSGPNGVPLASRVGIATGVVIVGDLIGSGASEEAAVVGETPNLAARMQGLAQPNQLVLPKETQSLLGDIFDLQTIGAHDLKGIEHPVEAFTVIGENTRESRFAARQKGMLPPIVGREQELGMIRESWTKTKSASGQMIIVSGEAGIGKSRITQAAIDEITADDHLRMTYQCSPYHADSAFYPFIQQLSYAAGFKPSDSNDTRVGKLEELLGKDHSGLQLVALMMELECTDRYGALDLSPAQQRARTMQVLHGLLVQQSAEKPVILIYEDLQWIDPTSRELLETLLDEISNKRVMILATARPAFKYGFGGHPIVRWFTLNRLDKDQIKAIVCKLSGGKELPVDIMEIIVQRTDGVPLFVEELTKTILESRILKEGDDCFRLNGPLNSIAIPSTLHDSLMARLDRLQPIKELAQMAACIGREFGHILLEHISPLSEVELSTALNGLIDAELIYRRGLPPESTYLFKHALVRDAAYESLLKHRRKGIHTEILRVCVQEAFETPLEVLAHHADEAGKPDEAMKYWEAAGDQAFTRPAFSEAMGHFEHALLSAIQTSTRDDHNAMVLGIHLKLCHASIARNGHAHPQTVHAFARARQVLELTDQPALRFPVLYGSWVVQHVSGNHAAAVTHAEQNCQQAFLQTSRIERLSALRVRATSNTMLGKFATAEEDFHSAIELFRPQTDAQLAWRYGTDLGIAMRCYLASSLLCRGELADCRSQLKGIEKIGTDLGHANTMGYLLMHTALINQIARSPNTIAKSEKAVSAASEYGLEMYNGMSCCILGGSLHDAGHYADALQQLDNGLALLKTTGTGVFVPYFLALHSSTLSALGQHEAAGQSENQALSLLAQGSELWIAPDIYRLLAAAKYSCLNDYATADEYLNNALLCARGQNSWLWLLRCTMTRVHWQTDTNVQSKAQQELRSVVEQFPCGGRDLPEMKAAIAIVATQ